MKNKLLLFLFCILPYLTIAQVVATHPRIFIDDAVKTTLVNRRISNTVEWQKMKQWVDIAKAETISEVQNRYEWQEFAHGCMLTYWANGDISYKNKALEIFNAFWVTTSDESIERDDGFDSRSVMVYVAMNYDWLYDVLSEPLRAQIRNRLVVWADWIMANAYGTWNGPYYYEGNNYVMGHILGITATAYAIYSEDPVNGQRLLDIANTQLARIFTFIGTRLKGGDANEGWSYGGGYAHSLFKTMAIVKTASSTHIDHFANIDYDEESTRFLIYATLPDKGHLLPEGDWARESSGEIWELNRYLADLISTYDNDETTRRIARFYGVEVQPENKWVIPAYWWNQFLFSNQEISPLDYRTVAPFNTQNYILTDTTATGQFIYRTNWLTTGQWTSFRAGGHYGDHAHDGPGHFNLWENGWLIVDRNSINPSGIEAQDDFSNAFQFYGNNKQIKYPYDDYPEAEHAAMPRREFTANYEYIYADNTPIYKPRSGNVVKKAERQWFYLPTQKMIVVFDNAETLGDTNTKAFRLTFAEPPTMAGNVMTYNNGTTKVLSHVVIPQTFDTYQPTETFGTCDDCRERYHYIDVKYTNKKKKNFFVNVIYTIPSASAARTISAISRAAGNITLSDFYGSLIGVDTTNIAVLFAGDSTNYNYDSLRYHISDARQSHHYILGLRPSANYYLEKSAITNELNVHISLNPIPNSTIVQTTPNGILEFHHNSLCIQNLTLVSPTDNISSGVVSKRVSDKITASNQLTGGKTIYDAGKAVELKTGFVVSNGGVFTAKIGGCEN